MLIYVLYGSVYLCNVCMFFVCLCTPAPPGMPAAPVIADKTKRSVTLSWTPPAKDGGSPIKGYIIEIQHEGTSDWARVNDADNLHPTTEFTIPNLQELKKYRFRIVAVNDIGESEPSPRTTEVLLEDIHSKFPCKTGFRMNSNVSFHFLTWWNF